MDRKNLLEKIAAEEAAAAGHMQKAAVLKRLAGGSGIGSPDLSKTAGVNLSEALARRKCVAEAEKAAAAGLDVEAITEAFVDSLQTQAPQAPAAPAPAVDTSKVASVLQGALQQPAAQPLDISKLAQQIESSILQKLGMEDENGNGGNGKGDDEENGNGGDKKSMLLAQLKKKKGEKEAEKAAAAGFNVQMIAEGVLADLGLI